MNDFNKPIRPIKRIDQTSLKKDVIISNFTKEEHSRESIKQKQTLKRVFLAKLKHIKDYFSQILGFANKYNFTKTSSEIVILLKLKSQLEKIGETQPADHPSQALEFASSWKGLIEFFQHRPNSKGQQLIDSFKTFPGRNAYSLHFYLTRFSGKEWFPLPFFELLKSLHEEYRKNKKNSQIDRWIHLIDEMISTPSKDKEEF
jgi:hypothetical protein